MSPVRLNPRTASQFDALYAEVLRMKPLFVGTTHTEAVIAADQRLVDIIAQAKAMRIALRGEIAAAKAYERSHRRAS